ncbi:3-oxoacyl-[acyl-carrier-protein] synthase, mitochondrial, partial [Stegodyphus mimosarum]
MNPLRHYTKNIAKSTRVVVTGIGIVCPLGIGASNVWEKLLNGKIGTVALTDPIYNDIPCKVAAFVPLGDQNGHLNLKKFFRNSDFKTFSMATAYALVAAKEAIADANLSPEADEKKNIGVAVGTGMVDMIDIITTGNVLKEKGYNKVSPFFVPRILSNMAAGHIAINYGFKGPNHSVSTACATGLHAIGDAYNFIRNKQASVMICGSTEAVISPISLAGFSRMRALSTKFNSSPEKASRPFDKDRDGFVMGEGAGILVLESLSHAIERNAKIYAEILGYGLSGDAYHITSPCNDGSGAYHCMQEALLQNRVNITDVGYINAHATSTPLGDTIEVKAIHDLFGIHSNSLVVSSTKGALGHLLGAAGSVEAIFTVLACFTNNIPANVNLDNPDIKLPVNLAGKDSQVWPDNLSEKRVALTNSFGFGGTNATLAFCKFEANEFC